MSTPLRIVVDELRKRMESGEDFTIVDVRKAKPWTEIGHHDSGVHSRVTRSTGPKPQEGSEEQAGLSHTALVSIRVPVWCKGSANWDTKMHGPARWVSSVAACRIAYQIKTRGTGNA